MRLSAARPEAPMGSIREEVGDGTGVGLQHATDRCVSHLPVEKAPAPESTKPRVRSSPATQPAQVIPELGSAVYPLSSRPDLLLELEVAANGLHVGRTQHPNDGTSLRFRVSLSIIS